MTGVNPVGIKSLVTLSPMAECILGSSPARNQHNDTTVRPNMRPGSENADLPPVLAHLLRLRYLDPYHPVRYIPTQRCRAFARWEGNCHCTVRRHRGRT